MKVWPPFSTFQRYGGTGLLAKAGAPHRFNPVPHRDDDIKVVLGNFPLNLTFPLLPNYPEIPDSYILNQLSFLKYIAFVLVHGAHILNEQLRFTCLYACLYASET